MVGLALLAVLFSPSCRDESVVEPEGDLPAVLAVDRPTVQLFRFARGRKVESDTVRISNNGEGPLGTVEKVGGVDYLTTSRTGWLEATVVNLGDDEAILVLVPTYAQEEQDAADIAEVVLKAQGSPDLKRVRVIARTLRGASFEFSVSPIAFAAAPGDPEMSQRLTVRNGGNGTLLIHDPTIRFVGGTAGWLTTGLLGGTETAPEFLIQADPGSLGGGLFQAYLVFDSPPSELTRANPDSVLVQLNIGKPDLASSTASLAFTVLRGAPSPTSQTITLSNSGEGTFAALGELSLGEVAYGPGATGWLQAELGQGTVTVSAQTPALEAGDYEASFQVVSGNGGQETVQVSLSVEAPILTAGTRAVSFGMVEGSSIAPEPRNVRITNTGSGTFQALGAITLGSFSPAAVWITAHLSGEDVVLTPTPNATSLSEGEYRSALPIRSQHGGGDTILVTLSVSRGQDPPQIALSANQVGFTGISGDPSPAPQQVNVSNAGGGVLGALSLGTTTYAGAGGWLTATLAGNTVTLTATTGTLPDGSHVATVPVSSTGGGSAAITVTFTVGSPILTASATSASFSAVAGGGNPSPQTITLSNTGPGTFASLGTITAGAIAYAGAGGWLTATYGGGTLTLSVTTGALPAGTYSATVPVNSSEGGSVSISVSFTVARTAEAADLLASPASVTMTAVRGGSDPPSQIVTLSNAGGGTLGALTLGATSYGGGASGWLTASLAGTALTLSASTGSLAQGTYTAGVTVSSSNGGNETVSVTFQVGAPSLTLSSTSASFSGVVGGTASPASLLVGISNTGAGDFSSLGAVSLGTISYGSGSGWLGAALAGGNTQVSLTATIGGLAAGSYSATVPVNSTAGGSGTVSVTLTVAPVAPAPLISVSATSISFYAEEGGANPASQAVLISNQGGGSLGALSLGSISYGVGSGWLAASLSGNTVTLSATTGTLTAAGGPYTATIPVQSANGGNQSVSVTFNLAPAGAAADLAVSPASVRAEGVVGGVNPPDQEVILYNAGTGNLGTTSVGSVTYGSGSGWLSTAKASSTVTLSYDLTGLSTGTYSATVELQSANGGNETVGVTLSVGAPELTLSSTSAAFSGQEGGAASPASATIEVSNSGAGAFSDLGAVSLGATAYAGGGSGWLTASLGGSTITLSSSMGALGPGSYSATVPVNSTSGGSSSLIASLTVTPSPDSPDLALSASTVSFTAVLGGSSPSPRTVNLSNAGGGTVGDLGVLAIGTINYVSGGSGWLSTSSITGSTLTLSPVTGSLASGTHTATVQATSQNGGNESVSVSVEVGSPVLTASTLDLSFRGLAGGAPPSGQAVTLANTGVGDFTDLGTISTGAVSYGPGASGWLTRSFAGTAVSFSADQAGLASGVYTASVTVSSAYGGSQTISVTFSVVRETDPPVMVLSATNQRFDAIVGGADPPPQTITASNSGGGILGAISVGAPAYGSGASGWLFPSVSGNSITTSVQTGALKLGNYTASLPVSSNGGTETVDVTFIVGTSRLTLVPRIVSFGDTVGGAGPAPAVVGITNTGGGSYTSLGAISLEPTIYGEGASEWLNATMPAPDSVRVQANTEMLSSRVEPYQAWVPVGAELGGGDTLAISFTVAPGTTAPSLTLSRDSMTFAGVFGAGPPPAQTVVGFNNGGGEIGEISVAAIEYTEGAADWLTYAIDDAAVTFQVNLEGVFGTIHRARVTIASLFGGSQDVEIALELALPELNLSSESVTFSDTVGSPDTLQSQVFISNTGAGNRASLGEVSLGTIGYPGGRAGWLVTEPLEGEAVEGYMVTLKGSGAGLSEGTVQALVPVESVWGGVDTVAVTFLAREPDRSFDLPTIQLVRDSVTSQGVILVPIPGDSMVVTVPRGSSELGVRVGVRNGTATRLNLSGLRVGIPTYPEGQVGGWITGAFLNRTTATYDDPAELFVVVVPEGLTSGRYEGRLVISSESAELETVAPVVFRVILNVT